MTYICNHIIPSASIALPFCENCLPSGKVGGYKETTLANQGRERNACETIPQEHTADIENVARDAINESNRQPIQYLTNVNETKKNKMTDLRKN